jgi:hypothetical protein
VVERGRGRGRKVLEAVGDGWKRRADEGEGRGERGRDGRGREGKGRSRAGGGTSVRAARAKAEAGKEVRGVRRVGLREGERKETNQW